MAAEDTGVMIALGVPAIYALDPSKVPADWECTPENEMHLTLAYMDVDYRDLTEEQLDAIKDTCRALAETVQAPRALFPASAGIFPADPEDNPGERPVPLWYAPLPDDQIKNLREELMIHLAGRGVADLVSTKHPNFNPHVTLAYAPEGTTAADIPEMPPPAPLFFSTLYLTLGPEWLAYDLVDPRDAQNENTATVPLTAAAEGEISRLATRYGLTADLLRGVYVSTPAIDRWDALHKTEQYARERLAEAGLVASAAPMFADRVRPQINVLLNRLSIEPDPTARALLTARAFALAASAYGNSRTSAHLISELRALTADGNSSAARSLRARRQLRDRKGRWIEMGGGVRWRIRLPGMGSKWFHGTVTGIDVPKGQVHVQGEDGKTYAIPNDKLEQPKAIIGLNLKSAGKSTLNKPLTPEETDEPGLKDNELLSAPVVSSKEMKEVGAGDVVGTIPESKDAPTDEELAAAAEDALAELKKRVPDSSPLAETRDRVAASLGKSIDRLKSGADDTTAFENNLNAIRDFANAVPDDASTADTDEHEHFAAFAEDLDNVAGASTGSTAEETGAPVPFEDADGDDDEAEFDAETKAFYDAAEKIGLSEARADELLNPDLPSTSVRDQILSWSGLEDAPEALKDWAKNYDKGMGDSLNKSDAAKQAVKDLEALGAARKKLIGDTSTEDKQAEVKQALADAKSVPAEVPDGPLTDEQLAEAWHHETGKLGATQKKFLDGRLDNILTNEYLDDEKKIEQLDKYLMQLAGEIGGTEGNPRFDAVEKAAQGWLQGKGLLDDEADADADMPVEDPTEEDFAPSYSDDPDAQAVWESMDDVIGVVSDVFTDENGEGLEIEANTAEMLDNFNNVVEGWDAGDLSDPEHIEGYGNAFTEAAQSLLDAMSADEGPAGFTTKNVSDLEGALEQMQAAVDTVADKNAPEPDEPAAPAAEATPAQAASPFLDFYHKVQGDYQGTPVSEPLGAAANAVSETGAQFLAGDITESTALKNLDAIVTDIDSLFEDPVYGKSLTGDDGQTDLGDQVEDTREDVVDLIADISSGVIAPAGGPADTDADADPFELDADADSAFSDMVGLLSFFQDELPPKNPTTKKSLQAFSDSLEELAALPDLGANDPDAIGKFESSRDKLIKDLRTDAPNKNKKLLTYEDSQDEIDGLEAASIEFTKQLASNPPPQAQEPVSGPSDVPGAETPAPAPESAPEESEDIQPIEVAGPESDETETDSVMEEISMESILGLLGESAEEGNPVSQAVSDALAADSSPEALEATQGFFADLLEANEDDEVQAFLADTFETVNAFDPNDIVEPSPETEEVQPDGELEGAEGPGGAGPEGEEPGEPAEPGAGGEAPGLGVDDGGAAEADGEPELGVAVQGSGIDNSVLGTEYTDGEKLAIAAYTGADNIHPTKGVTAYRAINPGFRPNGDHTFSDDPWSKRIVDAMDSAMSRSSMPATTVYRGSNNNPIYDAKNTAAYNKFYASLVPGAVVTNDSYLSTTNHPEWAEKVAKVGLSGKQNVHEHVKRVVWEIDVPEGSKMLRTFSNNGYEDELLAAHGSRLQITEVFDEPGSSGVFNEKTDIRRVKAILLPPAEGTYHAEAVATPAQAQSLDDAISGFALSANAQMVADAYESYKHTLIQGQKSKTDKWAGVDSQATSLQQAINEAAQASGDFVAAAKLKAAIDAGGIAVTDKLNPPEAPSAAQPGSLLADEDLQGAATIADFSGWTKTGGEANGFYGGSQYETADGGKAYVKPVKSKEHAQNEVLASLLYKDLGIHAPRIQQGSDSASSNYVVSYLAPGASYSPDAHLSNFLDDEEVMDQVKAGYVASAWMANWNVISAKQDNIVVAQDEGSKATYYIDGSGALLYRGNGQPKGSKFSPVASELETMKSPVYDPNKAKVYGSITPGEVKAQVQNLADTMTDERIAELVNSTGLDPASKQDLIQTLTTRKYDMMAKVGVSPSTQQGDGDAEQADAKKASPAAAALTPQPGKPFNPAAAEAFISANKGTEADQPVLWVGATGTQLKLGQSVVSVKDGLTGKVASLSSNGKYAKIDDGSGKFKYRHPSTMKPVAEETPAEKAAEAATAAFAEGSAPEAQTPEEKKLSDEGLPVLSDDELAALEVDDSDAGAGAGEYDYSQVDFDETAVPEADPVPQAVPAAPAGAQEGFDPANYEFKQVTANNAYPGMVNKKGETLLSKTAVALDNGKPGWIAIVVDKTGKKKPVEWKKYSGIGAWADGEPLPAPEPEAPAPAAPEPEPEPEKLHSIIGFDPSLGYSVPLSAGETVEYNGKVGTLNYVPIEGTFGNTWSVKYPDGTESEKFAYAPLTVAVPEPEEEEEAAAEAPAPAKSLVDSLVENASTGDFIMPVSKKFNNKIVKTDSGWVTSTGSDFPEASVKALLKFAGAAEHQWDFVSANAEQPGPAVPKPTLPPDFKELPEGASPVFKHAGGTIVVEHANGELFSYYSDGAFSKVYASKEYLAGSKDWEPYSGEATVATNGEGHPEITSASEIVDLPVGSTVTMAITPDPGLPGKAIASDFTKVAPGSWSLVNPATGTPDPGAPTYTDESMGSYLDPGNTTTKLYKTSEGDGSPAAPAPASSAFNLPAGYAPPEGNVVAAWKFTSEGGISTAATKQVIMVQTDEGMFRHYNDGKVTKAGSYTPAALDASVVWQSYSGESAAPAAPAPAPQAPAAPAPVSSSGNVTDQPAYSDVSPYHKNLGTSNFGVGGVPLYLYTKVENMAVGKTGKITGFDSKGNAKVFVPEDGKVRLWKKSKLALDNSMDIPTDVFIPSGAIPEIKKAQKALGELAPFEVDMLANAGLDFEAVEADMVSGDAGKMNGVSEMLVGSTFTLPDDLPEMTASKLATVAGHIDAAVDKINEYNPASPNPNIPSGAPLDKNSIPTFDPGTVWIAGDLDESSPWYGKEKPTEPAAPDVSDIPKPLDESWVEKFKSEYEAANPNVTWEDTYRSKKFEQAMNGSEYALNILLENSFITEDDYDAAKASVQAYMDVVQAAKDDHVKALQQWNQDLKDWTAANGKGSVLLKGLDHDWLKMGNSEAVSHFNKNYKPQNLTSAQYSAVSSQKGSSSFQSILRSQLKKESLDLQKIQDKSTYSYNTTKNLDSAVMATKPLEDDIVFIRTLGADSFTDPATGNQMSYSNDLAKLVGSVQEDFGFPEASPGSPDAGATPGFTAGGVNMIIHAPKGTRGVWTGGGSNQGSFGHPGERGFIFERGLKYYVHKFENTGVYGTTPTLYVEILPKLGNYGGQNYYDLFEGGSKPDVIVGTPGGIVNQDGSINGQQADGTIDSGVTPFSGTQESTATNDPSDPFGDGIQF